MQKKSNEKEPPLPRKTAQSLNYTDRVTYPNAKVKDRWEFWTN